jgi:hypothetical protein
MKIPISIMVASIMSVGTLGANMNNGYNNEMSSSYGKTDSYSAPKMDSYSKSSSY